MEKKLVALLVMCIVVAAAMQLSVGEYTCFQECVDSCMKPRRNPDKITCEELCDDECGPAGKL